MNTVTIKLGLSDEELIARRSCIGGSDANILMSGDESRIYDLWLQKRGVQGGPDLSDVLAVQCGIWTEELNARWFAKMTGRRVTNRNELRRHPSRDFMAVNLDGITTSHDALPAQWEAKWTGAFNPLDGVTQRYMPQLHHGMACLGVERAVLSVITGKPSFEFFEVERDDFYLAELVDREAQFWACVRNNIPPNGFKPVAAPVPKELMRQNVDLAAEPYANELAGHLCEWREHRIAAATFKAADAAVKKTLAADLGSAFGFGISLTRNKAGAVTIKLMEGANA